MLVLMVFFLFKHKKICWNCWSALKGIIFCQANVINVLDHGKNYVQVNLSLHKLKFWQGKSWHIILSDLFCWYLCFFLQVSNKECLWIKNILVLVFLNNGWKQTGKFASIHMWLIWKTLHCLKLTLQLHNFAKDECLNWILLSKHFLLQKQVIQYTLFLEYSNNFYHLVVASIIFSNISRVQFNFSKMIGEFS